MLSRKSEISKEEVKSKKRQTESVNNPNNSGLQGQKMKEKKSIKPDIYIQETAENSKKKCCEYWKKYMQTTMKDERIEYVSSRNWLH
jgi:hypothetical protein